MFGRFKQIINEKISVQGLKEAGYGLVRRSNSVSEVEEGDQGIHEDFKLLRNAYINVPLIASIVDVTVEQVVQEHRFEGPNKDKLEKFSKDKNLSEHFKMWCTQLLVFGNSYHEVVKTNNEIKELKLLNPEWMHVYRKPNGEVIGYGQIINNNKEVLWGTTGDGRRDRAFRVQKKNKLDTIIHLKYNDFLNKKYGIGLVRPMLKVIDTKLDIEEELDLLVHRYVAPLIHAKVGSDAHPASDGDVTIVGGELEDIHSESEIVTSHLVDLNVLGFDKKGIDIKTPLSHVDKQIISGGKVPPLLIGMTDDSASVQGSETQLRSFGRHIKSIQRMLKVQVEDKLLRKHGLANEEDEIIWGFAEEREYEKEIEIIRGLVTDGILTPQKANDLLPPKFHEKLPEVPSVLNQQAVDPKTGMQIPRQSQGKGADKISPLDSPNDPSKKMDKDGNRKKKAEQ